MGDISREPLPGGQRKGGGPGRAPSDLIRFEELGAESEGVPRARDASEDPDAAHPVATVAEQGLEPGERMSTEPQDDDPGQPDPREGSRPELRAAEFLAQRFVDPAIPLEVDPFGVQIEGTDSEGTESEGTGSEGTESEGPVAEVETATPDRVASAPSLPHEAVPHEAVRHEAVAAEGEDEEAPAVPTSDDETAPSEAELAADLGVEGEAPAVAVAVQPEIEDAGNDSAPALHDPHEIARVALAVLLASREAMSPTRLAEVLDSTAKEVDAGLAQLAQDLRAQGMPLELLAVDGAYRIATAPAVYPYLVRLKKLKKAERLTPAALETLAVIAYRQPVIRAEIEAIRGVKAGPVLKSLLDHKLVKAVGRADVPGRPLQYGTTQTFLDRFGLRSLDDLPSIQELRTLG